MGGMSTFDRRICEFHYGLLGYWFWNSRVAAQISICSQSPARRSIYSKTFSLKESMFFDGVGMVNGNAQAMRIPSELAYSSWDIDLVIERQGDELRIRPAQRRIGDVMGNWLC
jgi:hypothetical protein